MNSIKLHQLCEQITRQFPVLAIPAQIINNRRWECLNDAAPENFPIAPPHRIKVSEGLGVVIYDWPKLEREQQEKILNMCEENMTIIRLEDALEIFNQQGCIGKKLLNSQGLELVHLTVGANSNVAKHALPYPVIFHVIEGSGRLLTESGPVAVEAGTTLECPPDMSRGWENPSSDELKLLVIKCMET